MHSSMFLYHIKAEKTCTHRVHIAENRAPDGGIVHGGRLVHCLFQTLLTIKLGVLVQKI